MAKRFGTRIRRRRGRRNIPVHDMEHANDFKPGLEPENESVPPQANHQKSSPHGRLPSYNFSSIPLFPPSRSRAPVSAPVQSKLAISQPGDKYEQEADWVAQSIVGAPGQVELKHANETHGEHVSTSPQPLTGSTSSADAAPNVEGQLDGLRGSGQPLPDSTRAYFEPRFGHDFSQVRIHNNNQAASASRALNAQAFTQGKDVYFGDGRYQPNTKTGQKLMAHELTHVIQQGRAVKSSPSASPVSHISSTGVNSVMSKPIIQRSNGTAAASPAVKGALDKKNLSILRQYRRLLDQSTLNAMQIILIEEKLSLADRKIRKLKKLMDSGSGTKKASAGAMVLVGGLLADDVTGIGVADDVAIPFVLLAAGALYLSHVISRTSAKDLADAENAAKDAVLDAIRHMSDAIAKPKAIPKAIPRAIPKTKTKTKGPLPIIWPHMAGRGLAITAPNPVHSIFLGKPLTWTTPPARNSVLIEMFRAATTVLTGQVVHHVTPLFLGGPDSLGNLAAVWISYHIAGHTALRIQPQLAFFGVSTDLYQHPPGTPYIVSAIV